MRTLIYSTADRGCIVGNIHLIVHNDYGSYPFDFWAYGDPENTKGNGLFVPRTGTALHHHFVLNRQTDNFVFAGGDNRIEVFVKIVGQRHAAKPMEIIVKLVGEQSRAMIQIPDMGLFYELDSVSEDYVGRLVRRSSRMDIPHDLNAP